MPANGIQKSLSYKCYKNASQNVSWRNITSHTSRGKQNTSERQCCQWAEEGVFDAGALQTPAGWSASGREPLLSIMRGEQRWSRRVRSRLERKEDEETIARGQTLERISVRNWLAFYYLKKIHIWPFLRLFFLYLKRTESLGLKCSFWRNELFAEKLPEFFFLNKNYKVYFVGQFKLLFYFSSIQKTHPSYYWVFFCTALINKTSTHSAITVKK